MADHPRRGGHRLLARSDHTHHANANIVVTVRPRVRIAQGRAAPRGSIHPTAAAEHAHAAGIFRPFRTADKERKIKTTVTDVSQVLPPTVRILAPSDPVFLLTSSNKLQIEAEAESNAANPVTALQLMVENRPYNGEASRVRSTSAKPGKVSGRWTVEFATPGTHQVYVRAEGKQSNGASGVVLVNYTPQSPAALVRPRLHVLAVGIDDYPGDFKLKCAVNDARGVLSAFEKYAGPLYEVKLHPLLNGEATRGRILDKLNLLGKETRPDDLAVLYYAGHGFRDAAKQFYLQPYGGRPQQADNTCVSARELRDAVVNLRCSRVVVILDACHGGAPGVLIRELSDEGCGAGCCVRRRTTRRRGSVARTATSRWR